MYTFPIYLKVILSITHFIVIAFLATTLKYHLVLMFGESIQVKCHFCDKNK